MRTDEYAGTESAIGNLLRIGVVIAPASILELVHEYPLSIPLLLASEMEVLLAQQRAEWARRDPAYFSLRLAEADSWTLYCSCLLALEERFAHSPHAEDETIGQFVHFLRGAVQALQDGSDDGQTVPLFSELL